MIIEMSVERAVTFKLLQRALSVSFEIDVEMILEATEYWKLANFESYLGVELMPNDREFQTYVVVHEIPDLPRNAFVIGPSIVKVLGCKTAFPYPYPEDEDDDNDPRTLVIFSPDGRKFVGYGESLNGKFEISSVSEMLMN